MKKPFSQTLIALSVGLALSACGGGGDSSPTTAVVPPPTQTPLPPQISATLPTGTPTTQFGEIDTLKFASTEMTTVVGAQGWKLYPIALKSNGSVLTGRNYTWSSSDRSVAVIGTDGTIAALQPGETTVTVSAEGKSASIRLFVKSAPASLVDLRGLFPESYRVESGGFVVNSNYSKQVSQQHLEHLTWFWTYFSTIFPKSAGTSTEMYLTQEARLIRDYTDGFCTEAISELDNRILRSCFDGVNIKNIWLVAPSTLPDFTTASDEIGHTFMFASTRPDTEAGTPGAPVENWVWFWEGYAVAFSAATIQGNALDYARLAPWLVSGFKDAKAKNQVKPLGELIALERAPFDVLGDRGAPYLQSGLLFAYVEVTRPGTLKELVAEAAAGQIATSEAAFASILSKLGMTTAEQLDEAYTQFALTR